MRLSSHTAGSWFPTGYYGHHRMRTRADFMNEYRQLAKPQPPQAFIQRSSLPANSHVFSLHDNKELFPKDVSFFGQGHGKKKNPEKSSSQSGSVWCCRGYPGPDHPLTSSYRHDYRREEPNVQMLVKPPRTSFDKSNISMYSTVHGTESPNHQYINAMSNEALMLSLQNRQHQAKLKPSDRESQDTVASCMSWYKPCLPPVVCNRDFNHIQLQPVDKQPSTKDCHVQDCVDKPALAGQHCGNVVHESDN